MPNDRLEKIQKLYEEDIENSFLLYALALEYQACGELSLSIEFFEKLRDLDPGYLGLYYPLTGLYNQVGNKDLALIRVKEGLEWALKKNNLKTRSELEGLMNSIQELDE